MNETELTDQMMNLSAGAIPCLSVFLDGVARVHRKYAMLYNSRTKRMNVKKAVELSDVVETYNRYASLLSSLTRCRCFPALSLRSVPEIQEYLALYRAYRL